VSDQRIEQLRIRLSGLDPELLEVDPVVSALVEMDHLFVLVGDGRVHANNSGTNVKRSPASPSTIAA
jgi:hypothetical protein